VTETSRVGEPDLQELLPLVRAYCDFYDSDPSDGDLELIVRSLLEDPERDGVQFLARDEHGAAVGFATLYWTWETNHGGRVGVMNDLFVEPARRGGGFGRARFIPFVPSPGLPWTVPPAGPAAWQMTLYELAGGLRARNDYALAFPVKPAARGAAGSPIVAVYGPGLREALVIDARRGDPVRRIQLADDARAFSTVVDGKPVAGVVLVNPLRVVLF